MYDNTSKARPGVVPLERRVDTRVIDPRPVNIGGDVVFPRGSDRRKRLVLVGAENIANIGSRRTVLSFV